MKATSGGLRPERSLVIGLGCLLGAYLFQVQRYVWGWGTIPGRGVALWVLVGLCVGIWWGWERPMKRGILIGLLIVLSSPVWLHELLRREMVSRGWLEGASIVLVGWAGWACAMPLRALVQIDLREEEGVALGALLGDLFLLAAILALLPYFGVLPVAAALGGALWFWLWQAYPSRLVAYASFFVAFAWGLLPWSSGLFLSIAGTWPVERREIDGQAFFVERDRRVPMFRMIGPGGEVLSADQHRFAEAMIAPWFEPLRGPSRVLLVGGEDGVLLREVLSSPAVARVDLLTARPARLAFFATQPILRQIHQDTFHDPRVFIQTYPTPTALSKAVQRAEGGEYTAILHAVDPPSHQSAQPLYSPTFFRALRRRLAPQGSLVVAVGNWEEADAIACVGHTLRQSGFFTQPYRASGMDITWTFWWAMRQRPTTQTVRPFRSRAYAIRPYNSTQQRPKTHTVRIPAGLRSIRQAAWPGMITFPRIFDPRRAPLSECAPSRQE